MCQVWCSGIQGIYAPLGDGGQSALGIYTLFCIYRSAKFGVAVFKVSVLDWGINLPWVYMHCAIYIWNLFGVMVLQRSMLNWRKGVESICHGYICIVLYMLLILCNGFPDVCVQLEEGVESICHGYMCIVLYMKLLWCNGFPEIYAQLEEGGGVNLPWVFVHCYIYIYIYIYIC